MTSWWRGEGYDPRDECPEHCTCSGCKEIFDQHEFIDFDEFNPTHQGDDK